MALRDGMTDIVAQVRMLMQDPSTTKLIDDDTVQSVLDSVSCYVVKKKLLLIGKDPGQDNAYVAGAVPASHWEGGSRAPTLKDSDSVTVAATADLARGIWTFTTARTEPVWLWYGYYHNIYMAVTQLCTLYIARTINNIQTATLDDLVDLYDVSGEAGNYSRSQIVGHLERKNQQMEKIRDEYRTWSTPTPLALSDD